MLIDGPHIVLAESLSEIAYLDSLCRQNQYSNNTFGRSFFLILDYFGLLQPYVIYIKAKLAFHELYPEFNGKFDFKDYIAKKGDESINRR